MVEVKGERMITLKEVGSKWAFGLQLAGIFLDGRRKTKAHTVCKKTCDSIKLHGSCEFFPKGD